MWARTQVFALAFSVLLVLSGTVLAQSAGNTGTNIAATQISTPPVKPPPVAADNSVANRRQRVYLAGLMVGLLAIAAWYLRSHKNEAHADAPQS